MQPEAILSAGQMAEKAGVVFILVLACAWLGFLYWKERQENRKLNDTLIETAKQQAELFHANKAMMEGLKSAMESVRGSMANVDRTLGLVLQYFSGRRQQ